MAPKSFSMKMAAMGAKLHRVDLYHLDFPNDTFDAVVSMAAFEFINDNEKALYKFMCVVKPGGKVLVGALTGNSSWGEEYKSHMWREDSVFRHVAFKTAEEMRGFLQPYFLANAESVFLPYTITEDRTTKEWDDYYRQQGEVGAFVCCLWQNQTYRKSLCKRIMIAYAGFLRV